MQQFILILQTINLLFPLVIQAITTIEAAFPQTGQGAIKLEMLRGMLVHAYEQEQGAAVAFDKLWPALQPVINGAVAMAKARV